MIKEADITRAILKTSIDELLNNVEVDVVIAGGGPSGLTCAGRLAKKGMRTVLFERRLNYGGGMPGGGMLFPRIVIQKQAGYILEEIGVKLVKFNHQYFTADSVETISKLATAAIDAGVRIYPAICVEDLVIKADNRISGVVINWTAVKLAGMHVDPLVIMSKYVVDATGHDADLTRILEKKNPSLRLKTKKGKVIGERSMWADEGEGLIVCHTREVCPGLILAGMAVNTVFGLPRMGAIFGGMLLSGQKAADLILSKKKTKRKIKLI